MMVNDVEWCLLIFLKLSTSCGIKVFFKTSNILAGTGILHQWFTGYLIKTLITKSYAQKYCQILIFMQVCLKALSLNHFYIFDILQMCRLFADISSLQHASYDKLDIEYNLNHDLHDLVSLIINPKQRLIFFLNKKQYNFSLIIFSRRQSRMFICQPSVFLKKFSRRQSRMWFVNRRSS